MAANPIDLTTVAEVKNYGVLAQCAASDGVIQDIITGASQYWLNRTGLPSLNRVQSCDDWYDGNGNNRLGLRSQLIISVSLLTINGRTIPQSTGPTVAGWVIDQGKRFLAGRGAYGTGGLRVNFSPGESVSFPIGSAWSNGLFARGCQNVNAQYLAGWIYPVLSELHTIKNQTIATNWSVAPNAWYSDQGVVYEDPTLGALTLVQSNPQVGQYTVSATGVYGFNPTDENSGVLVSYTYQGPPADVYAKVTKQVCVEINRLGWLDQAQRAVDGGTIKYQSWDVSPDIEAVIQSYVRRSRG